jgi:DNA-binding response OmpR family regulator
MSRKNPVLLLVEDDKSLGYLLSEYLRMKNYKVKWAQHGKEALTLLDEHFFDLAILDVMLPEMDGFTLAKVIKEEHPKVPFLFLTAKSLKVDVLKGFYLGAVDYLKKPIDEEELVIRIENLLSRIIRKEDEPSSNTVRIGRYTFNVLNQELAIAEEIIPLTAKESELLQFMVQRANQLSPHKDILIKLWGRNDYFNRKSLNVFITHLRKYLKKDADIKIENVHGKGYILRMPAP